MRKLYQSVSESWKEIIILLLMSLLLYDQIKIYSILNRIEANTVSGKTVGSNNSMDLKLLEPSTHYTSSGYPPIHTNLEGIQADMRTIKSEMQAHKAELSSMSNKIDTNTSSSRSTLRHSTPSVKAIRPVPQFSSTDMRSFKSSISNIESDISSIKAEMRTVQSRLSSIERNQRD